jgi:hypothetical protein
VRAPVRLAPVDDAVGAGGDAIPAAIADVLLDDDRAELGAEERAGGTDLEARRRRAVLAHVRGHEPARRAVAVLFDERDVAPRVGPERPGVVVGVPGEVQAVLGDVVPLLACNLARLAADADRRIGEEADALAHAPALRR